MGTGDGYDTVVIEKGRILIRVFILCLVVMVYIIS